MPKPINLEPAIVVNSSSVETEASASSTHAANALAAPVEEAPPADPRLDGAAPGEVFARACPKCSVLKMTADQSGKTPCRRCRVKAGEPYESAALPPPPSPAPPVESPALPVVAPGTEVSRVDHNPL